MGSWADKKESEMLVTQRGSEEFANLRLGPRNTQPRVFYDSSLSGPASSHSSSFFLLGRSTSGCLRTRETRVLEQTDESRRSLPTDTQPLSVELSITCSSSTFRTSLFPHCSTKVRCAASFVALGRYLRWTRPSSFPSPPHARRTLIARHSNEEISDLARLCSYPGSG